MKKNNYTKIAKSVSAKQGTGIKEVLQQVVDLIPPPSGKSETSLRALIFDSWFDSFLGIVIMIRVMDGSVRVGDKIRFISTGKEYEVVKLGIFNPFREERPELGLGEVGFLCASIKTIGHTRIGDTVTNVDDPCTEVLSGYADAKAMVFSGIFPDDGEQYDCLLYTSDAADEG